MFLSYSGITPWLSSCHCSLLQGIGSYFFVNIENMEENGNVLIIALISVKNQRFTPVLIIFYYLCPKITI